MSEESVVQNTQGMPVTVSSLKQDLGRLGVKPGMVLLAHSSLSALGWVCGGPVAVVLALEEVLGADGTLVMPAFTGALSEPSLWVNPPVPEAWWPVIRAETPPFDPGLTPTRAMGAVAETFRTQPGVRRSSHPQVSFAAWGRHAQRITAEHTLDYAFGERSPAARIYDLGGYVLLLGVTYENNSSLHLAEYRAAWPGKRVERSGAPMMENGQRVWREVEDYSSLTDDFEALGQAFEKAHPEAVTASKVGQATARLMSQRALVDFAIAWMTDNRKE